MEENDIKPTEQDTSDAAVDDNTVDTTTYTADVPDPTESVVDIDTTEPAANEYDLIELKKENDALQASVNELSDKFEASQKHYEELQESYAKIQAALENVRQEAESLREFKNKRDNADKDALIAKYHMLDDEDKRDVIENKEKYSLEEIEEKLALAYVRRNVDFNTVDGRPDVSSTGIATTFTAINDNTTEVVDPMVEALREVSL